MDYLLATLSEGDVKVVQARVDALHGRWPKLKFEAKRDGNKWKLYLTNYQSNVNKSELDQMSSVADGSAVVK